MASDGILGPVAVPQSDLMGQVGRELNEAIAAKVEEIGPLVASAGLHLHQGVPTYELAERPFPEDRVILRINVPMRLCGEKHQEETDGEG